jgi:hypothetical protein
MTDYEDQFVSLDEVGGLLPINNTMRLHHMQPERWPANHAPMMLETVEERPTTFRSPAH